MLRLTLVCLLACGHTSARDDPETAANESPVPVEVTGSTDEAAESACPIKTLGVPTDMPLDAPPSYTRAMWLEDSLATADVVVVGTLEGGVVVPTAVVCGEGAEGQDMAMHPIHRERHGEGLWILVRTLNGYLSVNPDEGPMPREAWDALVLGTQRAPALELTEHSTGTQIHRTIFHAGREQWHGVEIVDYGNDVHVVLYDHGESVARRVFDRNGLERVIRNPREGRGFMFQNARGTLWRFEHYIDRALHGVRREYRQGTERLRREAHFANGRPHGQLRTWNDDGTLERDVTFEEGLVMPVVGYRGPPGEAELHIGTEADEVGYSAPRALMDRIRVGMSARRVADLLRLPVSPAMGIRFNHYFCDEALVIRFERNRVVSRDLQPNGAHCE